MILFLYFSYAMPLLQFRHLIVGKFNLRNLYKFDGNLSKLHISRVDDQLILSLKGRTFTFKQLTDLLFPLKVDFINIFTNNPSDLDNFTAETQNVNYTTTISVSKFIK